MDLIDGLSTPPDFMDDVQQDPESPRDSTAVSLHHYWPVVLGDPPVCTSTRQGVEQSFVQYLLLWQATKQHLPTVRDTFQLTAAVANSAFLTLQTPIFTENDYTAVVGTQADPGTALARLREWAQ